MRTRLTQKQENFVLQYFQTGNATQSAIVAGYSLNTAQEIGSENLLKPMIASRLDQLRKKAESSKIMSVVERKERLSEIARADLTDYHTESGIIIDKNSPNTGAIESIETITKYSRDSLAGNITIKRPEVPEAMRNKIFERDGNKCVECGATDNLQIDHVKPLSRGGKTVEDNLQTLCELCNKQKAGGKKNRPDIVTRLKLHSPIQAIAELNKMDGAYAPQKMDLNLNITWAELVKSATVRVEEPLLIETPPQS